MLRFVVLVMFAATAVNAGFYKHRYFTTDMNGFHNFGHHGYHGYHEHHGHRGFDRFDQFGPPFGPQFHHGHGHNQHTPQCNHKPDNGFGTFPFAPNAMPTSTVTAPFIPNINNPFFHGTHFPFNPQNPFLPHPNQNGGNVPSTIEQNNFGYDPTHTNTLTPIDANTALDDHSSTTMPTIADVDNGGNESKNSNTQPNQTNGSTDSNQNSGTGTSDGVDDPSSAASTPTAPLDQGKNNGLDYDIDVRFSDGKNNNETNQKPLDTNKP